MTHLKIIIGLSILTIFLVYTPKVALAGAGICGGQPGFSFAKDTGVTQGWLVKYNGDNQAYAGIPCKNRSATQDELNKIISSCCIGNAPECLTLSTLTDWESTYPTCKARNLEVKNNSEGKLEAFDIKEKITSTPTPSKNTAEVTPSPQAIQTNNENFVLKLLRQIKEFFLSVLNRFR